jgi:hypothetical protein
MNYRGDRIPSCKILRYVTLGNLHTLYSAFSPNFANQPCNRATDQRFCESQDPPVQGTPGPVRAGFHEVDFRTQPEFRRIRSRSLIQWSHQKDRGKLPLGQSGNGLDRWMLVPTCQVTLQFGARRHSYGTYLSFVDPRPQVRSPRLARRRGFPRRRGQISTSWSDSALHLGRAAHGYADTNRSDR